MHLGAAGISDCSFSGMLRLACSDIVFSESLQPSSIRDVQLAEPFMKQIQFLMFCLVAAVLPGIHSASGQVVNATMQTVSQRAATTRSAPAAKPIAHAPFAPRVAPRPAITNPRMVNSFAPRTIAQPPANLQRIYSPLGQTSNPAFAALNVQRGAPGQQAITVDPATRQTELRTLAAMHQRRGIVTRKETCWIQRAKNEMSMLTTMCEQRGIVTGKSEHA